MVRRIKTDLRESPMARRTPPTSRGVPPTTSRSRPSRSCTAPRWPIPTAPPRSTAACGDPGRRSAERCRRLASALQRHGVGHGDTVAVMAANTPELFEAHFGVPLAGGVLNAINVRLDAGTVALHPGTRRRQGADHRHRVRPDREGRRSPPWRRRRLVIDIRDPAAPGETLGVAGLRGAARHGRPRLRRERSRPTSGTPSPSTTPPAPPAGRRACSTTTAAPT